MNLEELKKLEAEATPGPWKTDAFYIVAEIPKGRPGGEVIGDLHGSARSTYVWQISTGQDKRDAALVVASRNALPILLEIAEAAQALHLHFTTGDVPDLTDDLDRLRAALAKLDQQ